MIMPGYSSTVLEYFLDSGTSQLATGPPIDLLSNLYASTSQTCAGTTNQLATGPTVSRPGASGKTFAAPAASFPVTPLIYYRFYMRGPSRNQLPWARY